MSRETPNPTPRNLPQADCGQSISVAAVLRVKLSAASGRAFEPDDGQMLPVGLDSRGPETSHAVRPFVAMTNVTVAAAPGSGSPGAGHVAAGIVRPARPQRRRRAFLQLVGARLGECR
jgi:hypothetical protein